MKTYEDLLAENKALSAQVDALSSKNFELTCYRVDVLRCLKTIAFEHNHSDVPLYQPMARQLIDSISADAELKEVQAEAGRSGFIEGYEQCHHDIDNDYVSRSEPMADEYAAKVRQG